MEYFSCARIISSISITQLTVNIVYCLDFRVAGVFCKRIENYRVLVCYIFIFMQKHKRHTAFKNNIKILVSDFCFTFYDNFITLNRYHFTCIFINEVLVPAFHNITSQLASQGSFHVFLVYLNFFAKVENLKNILIAFKSYCAKHRCNRQLLLTVNVSIHYIINIRCELNPRALEWNNTSTVKHCTICMNTLTKENTWRTVQLRNNHTLSTIDDKCTITCHIRYCAKEHILNKCSKILMVWVGTVKLHLSLQRYTICQATLQAF